MKGACEGKIHQSMEANHKTAELEEVLEVEGGRQSVDNEQVKEVGEGEVHCNLFGVESDAVAERTHQVSVFQHVRNAEKSESQNEVVRLVSSTISKE